MDKQPRFLYLVLFCVLLYALLFTGAGLLLASDANLAVTGRRIYPVLEMSAFISAVLMAAVLAAVHFLITSPLKMLAREMRIIAGVNPGHRVSLHGLHLLGDVPALTNSLGEALMRAKREYAEAAAAGSTEAERSRSGLESILMSLKEGIIVCDERSRIVFYNHAAGVVFKGDASLGLGRPLYRLCPAAPIESLLTMLRQRRTRDQLGAGAEEGISFVTSAATGTIISCSLRLLPPVPGMSWSFIFGCSDISREADARGRRENVMRAAVRTMQGPLTSLRLAADSLELVPDMDAESRTRLEQAMLSDTRALSGQFDILSREIEEMEYSRYPVSDVYTEDIVSLAARRLEPDGIRLTMTGDPLWIKAEVHPLILLVEFLARKISAFSHSRAIDIETLLGDRRVYFNFYWYGPAVPEAEISEWKAGLIEPSGIQTAGDVISRHGSEIWSMHHAAAGYAVLRLPMPSSTRQWEPAVPILPSRPVYADLGPSEDEADEGRMADLQLNSLAFVVFDTETTGLAPLEGDEIISIAGVKIINRGIVMGETFDMLVDPGRSIPLSSVRFHGITDDMVKDKLSIDKVLRSFHSFVGDAVMVGHNAAFDMRFIRMKEKAAGVRFRGQVLDTLSISLYLHDHTPEHSLDAVARRLGVDISGRHTALGDSFITAQVFIRFLYLLQERGITTMGQLLKAVQR